MLNENGMKCRHTFSASSPSQAPVTDAYTKHGEIGRGRFAKVCKVTHKATGNIFAAKIIRRRRLGKDTTDTIQKEINILELATASGVDSIVSLRNVFSSTTEVTLVLDYAAGGELFRLVCTDGPLPEPVVRLVIAQLLDAVCFLHTNQIVHLDIKPDNILLHSPYPVHKVLLCDFGLAKYLDEGKEYRDLVGTPDYVAPEILDYAPITVKADMWSVGVLTFFLLSGISPFMGDSKEETLSKISLVQIDYSDLEDVHSDEVRKFLTDLIQRQPSARLSASMALGHEWLKGVDITTLTNDRSSQPRISAANATSSNLSCAAVAVDGACGTCHSGLDTNGSTCCS